LLLGILVRWGEGTTSAQEPANELKERPRLEGEGPVVNLAFSGDGKTLACLEERDRKSRVVLWNPGTGKNMGTIPVPDRYVIALSQDGKTLAGMGGGTLHVWNTTDGKELLSTKDEKSDFHRIALSPDGKFLATGQFSNGYTEIREVATGKVTGRF